MANTIKNAAFLDGTADWSGLSSTDEATLGAPGRIVAGATATIQSSTTPVTAGQVLEVSVLLAGVITAVQVVVGGNVVSVPLERAAAPGGPYRGVLGRMASYYGRVAAPGTGDAFLRVTGTGQRYILQPFLNPAPVALRPLWQVGPHTNPDLNMPVWPSELPWPTSDGGALEPIAQRRAFAGDSGIPTARRLNRVQHKKLRADYMLNTVERDVLDQFYQASNGAFWFTRPDTRQLCRATWLDDGDPADAGLYAERRKTNIGLLLRVA